jgi:hypothetical protein
MIPTIPDWLRALWERLQRPISPPIYHPHPGLKPFDPTAPANPDSLKVPGTDDDDPERKNVIL